MKIKGIPVGTTMPRPDWSQDDPKKADYILNRPFKPGEGYDSIVQVASDAETNPLMPQSTATGESSVALGRYNKVAGKNAMAVNYDNQVNGEYAFAANSKNVIGENANASFASGYRNEVYAPGAFVAGLLNDILEEAVNGFVAGQQNILDIPDGARFGRFSKLTKALFAIGNGHGTQSRSNAFEVFEDGSMALNGETFTAAEMRTAITQIAALASVFLDANSNSLFTTHEIRNAVEAPSQIYAISDATVPVLSNHIRTYSIDLGGGSGSYLSSGYVGENWEFIKGTAKLQSTNVEAKFTSAGSYIIVKVNDPSFSGTRTISISPAIRSRQGSAAEVYALSEDPSDIVSELNVNSDSYVGTMDTYYSDALTFRKTFDSNSFYLVFISTYSTDAPTYTEWFRISNISTSLAAIPVILYGTAEPDNSIGNDGDIYIMYEE